MKDIEKALAEIGNTKGVKGVLVASTSGSYIAGTPPASAHLETFTTMSAILLGAAQTATKELKDTLRHVEVKLHGSRLLVFPAGPGALIVIEAEDDADSGAILSAGKEAGRRIERILG